MPPEKRQQELRDTLEGQIWYSERKATSNHYLALTLMVLALGCTVLSAILGIFRWAEPPVVGGIAALPAVIALVAMTLKIEERSYWSYRKAVDSRNLLRRLLFEGPDPITNEHISAISKEFRELDDRMAQERARTLSLNFADLMHQKPTPQSNVSSATPSPGSQHLE